MVGVVDKSKACHACRKRRVVCDFGRPHCLRCQRAGLECTGYQRRALFVNRTIANSSSSTEHVVPSISSNLEYVDEDDIAVDYRSMSRALTLSHYDMHDFRAAALRILSRLYLPRNGISERHLAVGQGHWVETACNCSQNSSALDQSLLALCASQLYITRRGNVTLDQALEVYSSGLSKLATDIYHVESRNLPCLLASIVALSTCELFICPSTSGWRAHVQGMAELLRFRLDGDYVGISIEDWESLCARARVVSVLIGLINETNSNITTAQWRKMVPNRLKDDALDELLDMASNLPAIFETPEAFEYPISVLLGTLKHIYDWEKCLRKRLPAPPYAFVPSQLHNPSDDDFAEPLCPLSLEFSTFQIASCLIVCWGVQLQTLWMILRLHKKASESTSLDQVWDFLDQTVFKKTSPVTAIRVEAKRRAGLLCQCVEYTHREEMGSIGPQSMVYAKGLLRRYFAEQDMSRELVWCRNIPYMTNQRGERFTIQILDFRA
ncbi:hypothetical protein CC79DRAFT_1336886 [Sarocladium strictum]